MFVCCIHLQGGLLGKEAGDPEGQREVPVAVQGCSWQECDSVKSLNERVLERILHTEEAAVEGRSVESCCHRAEPIPAAQCKTE